MPRPRSRGNNLGSGDRKRTGKQARYRRPTRRLWVEQLEDRRLLTAFSFRQPDDPRSDARDSDESLRAAIIAGSQDAGDDIIIRADGPLTVDAPIINNSGGDIIIRARNGLTINAPIINSGGGDITLIAEGANEADDLTINADLTATGGNGDIHLYAGDTISLTGASRISAAGSIGVLAGTDYSGVSPVDGTTTGDLTMADGTTIEASVVIQLDASRDVIVSGVARTAGTLAGSVWVTADMDSDGVGGVRVTTAGEVEATGQIEIRGSDLYDTPQVIDSVEIESDGENNQLLATGAIHVWPCNSAPAGARTIIDGRITSTGYREPVAMCAVQDVLLGENGDVSSLAGPVSVYAAWSCVSQAADNGGQIQMQAGASIIAGGGLLTNIYLLADGNIHLTGLATMTGVHVASAHGAIVDAGDVTPDIIASGVTFRAETGIGTHADAIDTASAAVSLGLGASTESGDIHVANRGELQIGNVFVTDNADDNTGNDNITVVASGPQSVVGRVVNNDGGNVTLAAGGTGTDSDLTIDANVTTAGGNGNIKLYAGDSISLTESHLVSAAGAGAVLGMAGTDYSGATPVNGTATGDFSMADGSALHTTGGDITVSAPGNVSLSGVNAKSGGSAARGNVTVTADYAGVGGGLSDGGGAIAVGGVLAGGTVMLAAPHIGITAAIDSTSATLEGDGDIIINGPVSAADAITVRAGNDGSGNVQVGSSMTTSAVGSDIAVRSGTNSGTIGLWGSLTAVDQITLESQNGAGQPVWEYSAIRAANLLLRGAGEFDLEGPNYVDTVAAELSDSRLILVNAVSLEVGTVGNASGIARGTDSVSPVYLWVMSGTLTVNQPITTQGSGGEINITGSAVINAPVTAGGGQINLQATGLSIYEAFDLVVNDNLTCDRAIRLMAPRDVMLNGIARTNDAGSIIVLSADTDLDGVGGVRVTQAGLVDSSGYLYVAGSDLFDTPEVTESVDIRSDGAEIQLQAVNGIFILPRLAAPASARMIINGSITSTGSGESVTIWSQKDVLVGEEAIINSAGAITIHGDRQNPDPAGAAITVLGDVRSATSVVIQGDAQDDTLVFSPHPVPQGTNAAIELNGQGGRDRYTVQFRNLSGPVNVADGGTETNDELTILGTEQDDFLLLDAARCVLNGRPDQAITYTAGIERLEISAGGGEDAVTVEGTPGATSLWGDDGNDTFYVLPAPWGLPGSGTDTAGPMNLDGGEGHDRLEVNDSADPGNNLGALTGNTVTGFGLGAEVAHARFEQLVLLAGPGDNTIHVDGFDAGTAAGVIIDAENGGRSSVHVTGVSRTRGGSLEVKTLGPILFDATARVETDGGAVTLTSGVAITMAQGAVVDADGGDVSLTAEFGVLLGRVVSLGAAVAVHSLQGGIAGGADPADPPDPDGADIEADRAVLRADGSIGSRLEMTPWGTVTSYLETKVTSLDAVSENGIGVFVVNAGPLYSRRVEVRRSEAPLGIDGVTPAVATAPRASVPAVADASQNRFRQPHDVNGDGVTSPRDVLLIINRLNQAGAGTVPNHGAPDVGIDFQYDVNDDGLMTASDVLAVINVLNRSAGAEGEPLTEWLIWEGTEIAVQRRSENQVMVLRRVPCREPPSA